MNIEFEEDYLRELFEKGRTTDKKHRFQPEVVRGYVKCVLYLKRAQRVEDLYPIHSLNYEMLRGDRAGVSSVRINNKYRLEFIVTEANGESTMAICNLIKISNHYQ